MRHTSLVLIALAIAGHVAYAQPGETAPSAPAPPPADNDSMVDQAIARAAAAAPTVEHVAMGALRRARRSVSVGPTVGLSTTAILQPGDVDAALSFGLGLELFDVPVMPSMEAIQELVKDRVKTEAKDRMKQVFAGRQPDPVEVDQLVAQIYADVRKEILGLDNVRPRTFEKPELSVALEANRLFRADRWLGRARLGIGVWKLTLGLTSAVGHVCRGDGCDDRVKVFVGPEIVVHALTSPNPRANVFDVFLRADLQANGRGTDGTYDQVMLGARFLLDVI
jgi:hypothetical protein